MSSPPDEAVLKTREALLPKGDDVPMPDIPITTLSDADILERLLLSEYINRSTKAFVELEPFFGIAPAESAAKGYDSFMKAKLEFLAVFPVTKENEESPVLAEIRDIEQKLYDDRKEEDHEESQFYTQDMKWAFGRDLYISLKNCKLPTHPK